MSIIVDFDTRLCMQLQEGNEEAFAQAFTRYGRLLYAIAYRYLKSGEEAEDAVQHTFMKLWEERRELDFRNGVRNLLCTILRHYVLNELRHRALMYEKHYELAQEAEETDESFMRIYEAQDLRNQLMRAIDKLPSQKSAICNLKLRKGLSNQEIAERMHLTVATVKSHYTQAIKMLRREFAAMGTALLVFLGIG